MPGLEQLQEPVPHTFPRAWLNGRIFDEFVKLHSMDVLRDDVQNTSLI